MVVIISSENPLVKKHLFINEVSLTSHGGKNRFKILLNRSPAWIDVQINLPQNIKVSKRIIVVYPLLTQNTNWKDKLIKLTCHWCINIILPSSAYIHESCKSSLSGVRHIFPARTSHTLA